MGKNEFCDEICDGEDTCYEDCWVGTVDLPIKRIRFSKNINYIPEYFFLAAP